MTPVPQRYRSADEDSARWLDFPFRDGDIVISTRSKSGTTWMQMICALLVFGSDDLPAPLSELSPWVDWLITPMDEVVAHLNAQHHRRFVKTHTPLDGIVLDDRAMYIVVCRNPLDMAVSLYHQSANINRDRVAQLLGKEPPTGPPKTRLPLREWLVSWTQSTADPRESMDSLPGVAWHASDAWSRRQDANIVLVHYDDLQADLEGCMRALAARLGIEVAAERWPDLVRAATFERMRADAARAVPDPSGVLKDRAAFFRSGRSGSGRDALTEAELASYLDRLHELAPPDVVGWLERSVHGAPTRFE